MDFRFCFNIQNLTENRKLNRYIELATYPKL